MKIIVTCGPSYEPIDEVRRITNFSTGQLGTELTNYLVEQGHEVICFRGASSTFCGQNKATQLISFSTALDLANQLQTLPDPFSIRAIFHVAAIGDYQVHTIKTIQGDLVQSKKISTSLGDLMLHLKPTLKILSFLKDWFPKSLIIGWKYEAEGNIASALVKGQNQVQIYQTDACVINGPILDKKFILYQKEGNFQIVSEHKNLWKELARLI